MKKSIKFVVGTLCAVAAFGVFSGCSMDPVEYTFEAEYAILGHSEDFDEGGTCESSASSATGIEEVESASNGASISYFSYTDASVTFVITSDRAYEGADFVLGAASSLLTYDYDSDTGTSTNYAMTAMNGSDLDILTVNGSAVALSGTLPGSNEQNYYNWGTLTATIDLVKGENTIVLTYDGTNSINIDYIKITAGANLTWTETDNTAE